MSSAEMVMAPGMEAAGWNRLALLEAEQYGAPLAQGDDARVPVVLDADSDAGQPLRVVAIGGGSGLSRLAEGFGDVTAIVTTGDDGGSSSEVSEVRGIIGVGDWRNCLARVAAHVGVARHVNYRFDEVHGASDVEQRGQALREAVLERAAQTGSPVDEAGLSAMLAKTVEVSRQFPSLRGHAYGNLLLAAEVEAADGKPGEAADSVAAHLGIHNAKVIPNTDRRHQLVLLENDRPVVVGQSAIDAQELDYRGKSIGFTYDRTTQPEQVSLVDMEPNPQMLEALRDADVIVTGVGSRLTSVDPVLYTPGVAEAVRANTKATVVATPNLILQPNELRHAASWQGYAQVEALQQRLGRVDVVVANANYHSLAERGYEPVKFTQQQRIALWLAGINFLQHDLVAGTRQHAANDALAAKRSPVMHDSRKLAELVREQHAARRQYAS